MKIYSRSLAMLCDCCNRKTGLHGKRFQTYWVNLTDEDKGVAWA